MNKNWKDVVVTEEATVLEVISVIDKGSLRIALVVDDDYRLIGTVSDGDIRRGILKHIELNTSISSIVNRSPVFVDKNTELNIIKAKMEKYDITIIPLIDDGLLVGLETLQHLVESNRYDNPVFLMAGGFGTRLQPLTRNCPKPMLKVGDKPILETILLSFIDAGFHDFYISTHFMPEVIKNYFGDGTKWNVRITYVHEESPLGTGGALGLLPDNLPDLPLLLMNGDILTKVDFQQFLSFHNAHDGVATICVREYEHQVPYGVLESDGIQILSMVEKPIHRHFVNAGIYCLSPEVIKSVPKKIKIDLPTHLDLCMKRGQVVNMFPLHEYWLDIGKHEDFSQAQIDVLSFESTT